MNIEDLHKPTTTDEELRKFALEKCGTLMNLEGHIALAELSLRSEKATRESIARLEESIKSFDDASEKYSRRIIWLTWVLIFLTAVLAAPEVRSVLPYLRLVLRH